MNIIISYNDNPIYSEFVHPFLRYYNKLGLAVHVAYVGNNPPTDLECADFIQLKPVDGIDIGIQAKLARSYVARTFDPNFILTLSDIDMFILCIDWYRNSIKKFQNYLLDGSLDLVGFGANGYKLFEGFRPDIDNKWTIPYTTVTSRGIQKLFNTSVYETFESFIKRFTVIENPIDGKESTANKFENFSDESLYRYVAMKSFARIAHVDIPEFYFQRAGARIDRVEENFKIFKNQTFGEGFWNQPCLTINQRKEIQEKKYIDLWPKRPYSKYKILIDEILNCNLELLTGSKNE